MDLLINNTRYTVLDMHFSETNYSRGTTITKTIKCKNYQEFFDLLKHENVLVKTDKGNYFQLVENNVVLNIADIHIEDKELKSHGIDRFQSTTIRLMPIPMQKPTHMAVLIDVTEPVSKSVSRQLKLKSYESV